MPIYRCARCLAADISADAHPARALRGNDLVDLFVCRECYRPAELAFRIACETSGVPYTPLTRREGLRRLALFYRDRLDAWADPAALLDDAERERATRPIRAALDEVERRLRVQPLAES